MLRYYLGWCAIFLGIALYLVNFVVMFGTFLIELRHAYRMYTIRRKFILAYGRKEMIQENYFKSSRDSGPRGSSSYRLSSRGSSRDDFSPSKKESRRSRLSRKSSLVQKNDIDDVYEQGYDDSPSPTGRDRREAVSASDKFLRKLKAREKAQTLDLVEERASENEFSDYGDEDRYRIKKKKSARKR